MSGSKREGGAFIASVYWGEGGEAVLRAEFRKHLPGFGIDSGVEITGRFLTGRWSTFSRGGRNAHSREEAEERV